MADGVYKVCSVAIYFYRPHRLEDIINSLTIRENDVFIFLANGFEPHENIPFINIIEKYNLRASDELWFSNTPIHVNQIGSKMVADEVCEKFLNQVAIDYVNEGNNNPQKIIQFPKVISDENAVFTDEYIRQYAPKALCNKIVGSIVMNCNPFTKGHEYLIEQSLTKVDYLYIFVVEEDKSYFSFEERMELVRRNMEKYENVIVLPSGKAILSMKTMSGYFMKETVQEAQIDATMDLSIFAIKIAPAFGISIRFVGEEPIDKITKQYNAAMKEMLPHYGIIFEEIPRKEFGDEVISASTVRKAIKQNDWSKIQNMVPEITYEFLKKKYGNEYSKTNT